MHRLAVREGHYAAKMTSRSVDDAVALATVDTTDLQAFYNAYVACLNARSFSSLGIFVHAEVSHNGRALGLSGYIDLLERDVSHIPDLQFAVAQLCTDAQQGLIAARLDFDCTPTGDFLGLAVNGRRVQFSENVFYTLRDGKIWQVDSVIDKVAIERQLQS